MNSYETYTAYGADIVGDHKPIEEKVEAAWKYALSEIRLLIESGYRCVVRCEDPEVIIIEYQYNDEEYGCDVPMWITQEEKENILRERYRNNDPPAELLQTTS